jgi:succinate dehydrogenase/fumarate reductase flavoprotein subunit
MVTNINQSMGDKMKKLSTDIAVIGTGAAGTAAALRK